jgi:hypothetical protein
MEERFQGRSQHFQKQETSLEAAVVRLSQAEVHVKQLVADIHAFQNRRQSAAKAQND